MNINRPWFISYNRQLETSLRKNQARFNSKSPCCYLGFGGLKRKHNEKDLLHPWTQMKIIFFQGELFLHVNVNILSMCYNLQMTLCRNTQIIDEVS